MKITLKLFAGLSDYLPAGADGNAIEICAPPPLTPRMLIEQHRLPRAEIKIVMINGEFLPPEAHHTPLQDGDVMAVWPSIQGG